jgi:transposase-like protein
VDETKIKARDRTYYLWLAVDEKGLPVFMHLSRRRDSWTAKLVLYKSFEMLRRVLFRSSALGFP